MMKMSKQELTMICSSCVRAARAKAARGALVVIINAITLMMESDIHGPPAATSENIQRLLQFAQRIVFIYELWSLAR